MLIGLAGESAGAAAEVLHGQTREEVSARLLEDVPGLDDLGAVSLIHWAATACGVSPANASRNRLGELLAADGQSTVELAWAVAALSDEAASHTAAARLMAGFNESSALFPHRVGGPAGLRSHVACFADQVYPIHALSRHSIVTRDDDALRVASRCAGKLCELLGTAGQWWWHYDVRMGRVIERYPVYAVHQDAMAPMALLELADAGGPEHGEEIERGLAWLVSAPELGGRSLVDMNAGIIWRKVARREPGKLVRCAQALAARLHPALRVPGVERFFPPGCIDAECRPYHLGWLLYAWRARPTAAESERWARTGLSTRTSSECPSQP